MGSNEIFWKKVKFVLLFLLAGSILFIVLTKFLFQVPSVESVDLLNSISQSEKILKEQDNYIVRIKNIQNEIDSLNFDIHQVQRLDEITKDIYNLQDIYKKNSMSNKYIFGFHSSIILQLYFDSKEELSSTIRNNQTIEKNLEECKANI